MLTTPAMVQALAVLQTAYQTGGSVGPMDLHLYQNDYSPGPGSLLADFTEADYDGYAAQALTLLVGPYLNPALQAEIQNVSLTFTPTGDTTPNVIYGYFVTDDDGNLFSAERFDSPRQMLTALDIITLLYTLVVIPGGITSIVQPLDS